MGKTAGTLKKKEIKIFLIYKETQSGAVAKSYMRKGLLLYEEMHNYFPIYEGTVSHIWLCNCSTPNFLIYEENFLFFFIGVAFCPVFATGWSSLSKDDIRVWASLSKVILSVYSFSKSANSTYIFWVAFCNAGSGTIIERIRMNLVKM